MLEEMLCEESLEITFMAEAQISGSNDFRVELM
jgi:hypothetical protein